MEKIKTILYSGFPAIGKSYFYNKSKLKVLDSDSSLFNKKHFPENYIKHIRENIGKVDVILISSHDIVRDALVKNNLEFTLIYPSIELKDEFISRCVKRGSDDNFINLISKNWNEWITQLKKQSKCNKIELKTNQYLSDVI